MSKADQYKVSWAEYDRDIRILARKIRKGGEKFDCIFTFSRGGLPIATHLSHLLKIDKVVVDMVPIIADSLIVDDVSDTGKTLLDRVRVWNKNCKIATLHRKDGTMVEPNYFVKTINQWIVYPWEK